MKKTMLCGVLAASMLAVGLAPTVRAQETEMRAPTNVFDGEVHPVAGTKYKMRFFARTKTTGQFPASRKGEPLVAQNLESASLIKFNADYDVVSVDSFGNHQARITYRDFTMDINTIIDGKSQPPKQKAAMQKQMNTYLKMMYGATFLVKSSPKNEVFAVYGLDGMRSRILKGLGDISPEARAGAESMLSELLSDKNAIKNFGKMGGQLPPYPMRVSESWDYSTSTANSSPWIPEVQGRRTLVSLTDGVATIKDTGTFEIKQPLDAKSPKQAPRSQSMTGTQDIVTRIDNETGMPLEVTGTQSMTSSFSAPYGSKGATISLPFSSAIEFRVVVEEK